MTREEFEQARNRLFDHLVQVRNLWDTYCYLFVGSERRVQMLNACAQWYFGLMQRVLVAETVLGISRLTDAAGKEPRSNLVLGTLLEDPALEGNSELKETLAAAVADAAVAAAPARTHRHKYIAHLDHATAVGTRDEPLPALSVQRVSEIIQRLEDVYNLHGRRVRNSDTSFVLAPLGGPDALVAILEQSERWRRYQQIKAELDASQGQGAA